MEARLGGGVTASANMWALLADNDPGDSHVAKRNRVASEDKQQVPNGEVTTTVPDVKVRSDKDGQKRKRNKKKMTMKKQTKASAAVLANDGETKTAQEPSKPEAPAAASGHQDGGNNPDHQSDDEEKAGDSSCGRLLFLTAVATALTVFYLQAVSAFRYI